MVVCWYFVIETFERINIVMMSSLELGYLAAAVYGIHDVEPDSHRCDENGLRSWASTTVTWKQQEFEVEPR